MSRISAVDPKQATGKAQELLSGVQTKIGMTPNLMRVMAHSPAVLDSYLQFSGALGHGELSVKNREQISLTVGQVNSCDYCLSAHTAIGKSVGLTAKQIRDARSGKAVDGKTNAILKFASQLVEKRGLVSDDDLAHVRDSGLNDAEVVEVVANTALNLFTNYLNHVAETEIDFPLAEKMDVKSSCSTESCSRSE